ncbi:MAG: hypothetical protein Q9Q40_14200, partial [Acidobacteriota bacterium]|nr:hypothetical protein [Acidobacteriota bacterium]
GGHLSLLERADGRHHGHVTVLKSADGRQHGHVTVLKLADRRHHGHVTVLKLADGRHYGHVTVLKSADGRHHGHVTVLKIREGGRTVGAGQLLDKLADGRHYGHVTVLKSAEAGPGETDDPSMGLGGGCVPDPCKEGEKCVSRDGKSHFCYRKLKPALSTLQALPGFEGGSAPVSRILGRFDPSP